LKTKEIAVTLPLAIILFEFTFFGFSRKKLLILLIPLVLGALVAAVGIAGSGRPLGELLTDVTKMSRQTTAIGRLDYLVTQFAVIATYLRLLVLPVGQNLDYDYPVYTSLFNLRPLWGLLLICGLLASALWAWRKAGTGNQGSAVQTIHHSPFTIHYSLLSFGLLWFFLTLSVESSFIPIADVIFEHRLYLPSVGFFLALSALVAMLARAMGTRGVTVVAALLVLTLATATSVRNRAWQSEVSIWQDTVVKSPQKFRPRLNLAIALLNGGDPAGAIEESRKALALDPKEAAAHVNLGAALVMTGKLQEAVEPLNRAVELDPEYVTAYTNLGAAHEKLGDPGRAEALYREALRRRPDLVVGKFNLAALLQRRGQLDEAEGLYRQILQVMPRHVGTLNNLGALLTSRGDHAGAAAALEAALAADPGSVDSRTLMADLALARGDSATALSEYAAAVALRPDLPQLRLRYANLLDRSRRLDEALAAYGEALRLDPTLAEAHNNRGVIYGSRGMLAEAAQEFRRAAQLSPDTAEYRENLARALQLSEERGAGNRK
jgi:tetratricopeptide (TPR) repeat protein